MRMMLSFLQHLRVSYLLSFDEKSKALEEPNYAVFSLLLVKTWANWRNKG
jgi:hypothetical protein